MRRLFKWDKQYLGWGITAFLVIAAAILFYMALTYIPSILTAIKSLIGVFSPFIWGLCITYLLAPQMHRMETHWFRPLGNRIFKKKEKAAKSFGRTVSVIVTEILLILLLVALVSLIIPQLYSSIEMIVLNYRTYLGNIEAWLDKLLVNYPQISDFIEQKVGLINDDIISWLTNSLLPQMGNVMTSVTSGVYSVVRVLYDLIIGIIISIYLLVKHERMTAGFRRLLYCIFSLEAAEKIRSLLQFTDKTLMGFLMGKIIDSAIIGVLCYICCAVMKMPYALLVSAIIGVTNIIPVFGPFIGAVPSALIILMVNPRKCWMFVIFILILQQLDGQVIGPKVLGNSVGVSGFWILFSILIGGSLFGFWGMLLGVPVFVVIYTGLNSAIVKKLRRSGLPENAEDYKKISRIDPLTRKIDE